MNVSIQKEEENRKKKVSISCVVGTKVSLDRLQVDWVYFFCLRSTPTHFVKIIRVVCTWCVHAQEYLLHAFFLDVQLWLPRNNNQNICCIYSWHNMLPFFFETKRRTSKTSTKIELDCRHSFPFLGLWGTLS